MSKRRYWLMKTEPSTFSFEDLTRSKNRTTSWSGVRNYQARNLMRDDFKQGDRALIYHSSIDEPHVAGIAEVVREGYEEEAPWVMVDVKATHRMKNPVTREILKCEPKLSKMMVLKKGARLSIQPVTEEEFEVILKLGKPEAI